MKRKRIFRLNVNSNIDRRQISRYTKDIKHLVTLTSRVYGDKLFIYLSKLLCAGHIKSVHKYVIRHIEELEHLKRSVPVRLKKLENAIFEVDINYDKRYKIII